MLAAVNEDPYIPTSWGQNQKGMQAGAEVSEGDRERAIEAGSMPGHGGSQHAALLDMGIHKQTTNRLLEPFLWAHSHRHPVGGESLPLCNNKDAHPEIQHIVSMARHSTKSANRWRCRTGSGISR